ncbi:MAG: hypothetical protein ABEJ91_03065 [Candidatus Nanohaloarchaea archaeon]
MSRYTINLGRARSFSRRKRASKAMKILQEQLEKREGAEVSISPEVNSAIWKNGMEKPPAKIEVEVVETDDFELRAVLPGEEVDEPEPEPEPEPEEEAEEEEEAEDSGEGADYDEIVSGTVSEAKEAVKGLDDPDYGAVLEAEEANKDRKTLKEWLESQM